MSIVLRCLAPTVPLAAFLLGAGIRERERYVTSQVSGTFTMNSDQQHGIEVGDTPGHMLVTALATGTNRSDDVRDPLNGAEVRIVSLQDLTLGNGTDQGYAIKAVGADSVIVRDDGRVHTTMTADGQPTITFEGTYVMVRGTGRFVGGRERGTWSGHMTSPTTYVVEWRGERTLVAGR